MTCYFLSVCNVNLNTEGIWCSEYWLDNLNYTFFNLVYKLMIAVVLVLDLITKIGESTTIHIFANSDLLISEF